MGRRAGWILAIAVVGVLRAAEPQHWIVTWGASPSPQRPEAEMREAKLTFAQQTVRQIVHCSAGGESVRLRLSNAFGKETVEIESVHMALREKDGDVAAKSDRVVTFSGQKKATLPPNAVLLSDPVELQINPGADLAVSLFIPKAVAGGLHYSSQQLSYIGAGDQTTAQSMPGASTVESWVFLSDVEVAATAKAATVVTFGDSITDGARSTVNANHRWPDFLAGRLQAAGMKDLGILDAGIGGNRIWHDGVSNVRFGVNALARFDRDVLSMPGVKYLIVLEGINDIGHPGTSAPASEAVSAEQIIAGLEQMAMRAHEFGIKVIGATLTPFADTVLPGYYTPERDDMRKKVNAWIRSTRSLDGCIDFEAATRDPKRPDHLQAAYDSGDHLHPNDAGYRAMAEAIDLKLLQ